MQLFQVISRSTFVAMITLTMALGASVNAEPIRVTRGPNGATHIVDSENIPADAKLQPTTEAHEFPALAQRGPGGALHFVKDASTTPKASNVRQDRQLVTRGPNGAAFRVNK